MVKNNIAISTSQASFRLPHPALRNDNVATPEKDNGERTSFKKDGKTEQCAWPQTHCDH